MFFLIESWSEILVFNVLFAVNASTNLGANRPAPVTDEPRLNKNAAAAEQKLISNGEPSVMLAPPEFDGSLIGWITTMTQEVPGSQN
jgi:hypothetical protein